MSQVYATEPVTTGRVVLETTHGPIDIQLWSRECPSTTKLFLQLCMDGFYDEMAFHRIMPKFLIQTGAFRKGKPTNEDVTKYRQAVEADVALERRGYELNSRIRFSHRGLVAMALGVDDDEGDAATLQPQFFITLDETLHLDGKHVIFGTVSGQTFFNAMRVGNTDVNEETGEPTILEEAPRITSTKIEENPMHTTLVPTMPESIMPWKSDAKKSSKKSKKKRKGVKNVNVLSFGDEMMDTEDTAGGMKSSHDLIESRALSKQVDQELKEKISKKDEPKSSKKKDKTKRRTESKPEKVEEEKPISNETSAVKFVSAADRAPAAQEMPSRATRKDLDEDKAAAKIAKADKRDAKPKISLVEARRAKYANKKNNDKRKREKDTLSKLMSFQSKVRKNANDSKNDDRKRSKTDDEGVYHGQVMGDDDHDQKANADWMSTKFKCRQHMDHDSRLGSDGRNANDDYKVVEGDRRPKDKSRHHDRSHKHGRGGNGRSKKD